MYPCESCGDEYAWHLEGVCIECGQADLFDSDRGSDEKEVGA